MDPNVIQYIYYNLPLNPNYYFEDKERTQLVTISAPHAQPHHEGKYRCNALHPTFHRLRVHHASKHDATAAPTTNFRKISTPSDSFANQPFGVRTITNDVVSDLSNVHSNRRPTTRTSDTYEFNEYAITESYMIYNKYDQASGSKNNDAGEAYESSEQIVVSVDGDPWINPVFRNSSTDPELFTNVELSQGDGESTVKPTVVAARHNLQLHNIDGQNKNFHHINNNACLACLALHADVNVGGIPSDDHDAKKIKQIAADGTTTVVSLLENDAPTTTYSPMFGVQILKPNNKSDMFNKYQIETAADRKNTATSITTSSNESLGLRTVGERTLPSQS